MTRVVVDGSCDNNRDDDAGCIVAGGGFIPTGERRRNGEGREDLVGIFVFGRSSREVVEEEDV
jgi:hypothetical protein